MLQIGAHLTISKGYEKAAKEAISIGANTFQFFTRNPRGGKAKALNIDDIQRLDEISKVHGFASLLAHAPYTYNLASGDEDIWELGKRLLRDDLDRLQHMESCSYIVLHPGSHVQKGVEYGIDRIAQGLNDVLIGEENTMVLLEGMAGKGTEIGSQFEELGAIIDQVHHKNLVGVCLDTCHLYSAGYDIVEQLDSVLLRFERIVGLSKLKAIHLNDSMMPFASHKDRHAKIGEGTIGLRAIVEFIKHPAIKELPVFLETPNEVEGYRDEIKMLRSELNK
ncbi:deoxyribonuclease-4 [Anaerosolibacter carboniphilus]|uniref:Probable endonuclease 4 n=1 Tax=Anaerosolibacter carboniphilus TaxID=1417629 RepID=A0A841KMY3_9FIRM|nr:deoxyribonuclease IV [Anaerosolibacter carboniphilus]MBB6214631.1 deoxyribonuclease-4 [Anaerosolibacter carboniphilus]